MGRYKWTEDKSFWPGAGKPLNSTDWQDFLQLQLANMRELASAAGEVQRELAVGIDRGTSAAACSKRHADPSVFLSVLAPDPAQHDFGPISPGGPSLNLSSPSNRIAATKWSIDIAVAAMKASDAPVSRVNESVRLRLRNQCKFRCKKVRE